MPATSTASGSATETESGPGARAKPIRVFVALAHGFGARSWTERWASGKIPGLNERLPYGYYHAADESCTVDYSEDANEGHLMKMARLSLRRTLGFDPIHVLRNRRAIINAELIWTHTELEYLGVLMLLKALPRKRRPKVIAQSVWLFDRWHELSRAKRWLYRKLLEQADILTVLSPEN